MPTNNPAVPTLSTLGWITNVAEKIDILLAHWVESDAEQDSIYAGKISNLQEIVQKYSDDPSSMANGIQRSLKTYLERYYPEGVTIEVWTSDALDQSQVTEFRKNINVTIIFVVNGKSYKAPHLLSLIDSKFDSFVRLNN